MPFRLVRLSAALLLLAATASAQTSYAIDTAHSAIVYSMSHPAHDWTGTSRAVSGTLTVQGGAVTGGRAQARVQSFDSGNRSRDSHMAEATESYIYHDVTFVARVVTMLPAAQQTADRNATVAGQLTFHNVSRPVTVPVRIDVSGREAHLTGSFDVTLTDFQIERPSLLGIRARDWIGLHLDLRAHQG